MKKLLLLIPILFVILFVFFITGIRFTALSAATSHVFLTSDSELIEKYKVGSSVIFLFKSEKEQEYRTVLSEKKGIFYNSSFSTYLPSYSSDQIQTVGGMSFTGEDIAATFLSIVSNTEDVSYIEVGVEPDIEKKEISIGERITFLLPYNVQIDHLYPTAFDKDGKELFYYGYPRNTHISHISDLKWHKIEE